MSTYRGWLPKASAETAPFWQGCSLGRLMLPRCEKCTAWIWYPRPFCPECESWAINWQQASGKATLYSFTVVHAPSKGWEDRAPYIVAMADLEEGPRLTATLDLGRPVPDPDQIVLGIPLKVEFERVTDEIAFPVFRSAQL